MEQNPGMLGIDLAKACDRCDHGVMAHRLLKLERWIYSLQINRSQHGVVSQANSYTSAVKSCSSGNCTCTSAVFFSDLVKIETQTTVYKDNTRMNLNSSTVEDKEYNQT